MSDNPVIDWMTLSFVPGLGSKGIQRLIARFGDPEALFSACRSGRGKNSGVRKQVLAGLTNPAPLREQAIAHLKRIQAGGAEAICPDNVEYPQALKEIADPPPVLYVQGRIELLNSLCLAMVGSRAATAYGKRSSFILARALASAGVTVVSGLALGVDSEAHSGALSVHGPTIGVLGCGLDVVYPRQNMKLYGQIRNHGLLVTEYPLGTKPDGFRFPARNRIIAGLSRGVVVVEAARKSGSLITAEMALDEGRDVFAVPGQIDSFKSGGTHWLLQQGAKLVQSADDILVELDRSWQATGSDEDVDADRGGIDLDPEARKLLQGIDVYPSPRNELIANSGLGPAKVTELLLLLELEGLVEMLPGDEIRRIV
ncbi:MAG: DNA-processing protein DprA [Thermodesulfobacteriota bacterium]|nr:DNA-processing protein DprA [Thermodesulfobacteriota bacterium]